jgi:hypothetical protein
MPRHTKSKGKRQTNTFQYYVYQGHSYCIEFDAQGILVGGCILQLDGSCLPISSGWDLIVKNNTPIPEIEAVRLVELELG